MYCAVSSCNSLLQEVREWCAGAGVKKELCNFTAIKSMSLYLWMGGWKSQTWECAGRIALGKKFPHLLPSPFMGLGAVSGWVIAITPGIACWQPWVVQGGTARNSTPLVCWTTLAFLAGSQGLLLCGFLRKSSLPAHQRIPHSCSSAGTGQQQTRRKAVLLWWPPNKNHLSYRGFLQLTSHSLASWFEWEQRVFREPVPQRAILPRLPKSKEGALLP